MQRIITYNLNENFIENVADLLCERINKGSNDFGAVACVFGGKRPGLFLKRALAKRVKSGFIPPRIFSMDDFMEYVVSEKGSLPLIGDLDAQYLLYSIAKNVAPAILFGKKTLSEFMPWAKEIISFIEQIDLENISDEALLAVEKSAEIGYEIPENINILLQNIIAIRRAYHDELKRQNKYSRGLMYQEASRNVNQKEIGGFALILFCNFYYLTASEQIVVKHLYQQKKAMCVLQGDEDDWPVLKKNAFTLGVSIKPQTPAVFRENFRLYQGFDIHSQASIVKGILENNKNNENTVVVVPRPETVIPLLSQISSELEEFNVSMGYPLKRSALYALFDLLFKVQESKKERNYYTKDYLNLLRHPLVKSISWEKDPAVTRVLIHKIEDILQGSEESSVGGSLFVSLPDIERENTICLRACESLRTMKISVSPQDCMLVLQQLHHLLLRQWEDVSDFCAFSERLGILLDVLSEKSALLKFSLNRKIIEKLYRVKDELQTLSFCYESFDSDQIWDIFREKLSGEIISFSGSPLRGTQILGVFETRSLNFENVIVIDVNEGVVPKLKIYEPLIPREVMLGLGLNRLEKDEEIQRYQFMRLISSACNVHLVYIENEAVEKSRFIEELLWTRQKHQNILGDISISRLQFPMKLSLREKNIKKSSQMISFLKCQTYSASRLNTYLHCPLRFYYQYVLGLREKEDLLEELDAAQVGTFIHELLEETLKVFIDKKPCIDDTFKRFFLKTMDDKFEREIKRRMRADSFLLKGIITARLEKFLEKEARNDIVKIIGLEQIMKNTFTVGNQQLLFTCAIDRIDQISEKEVQIIDYKTGGSDAAPKNLAALEEMEMDRLSIRNNLKSFQLPLYYYFVQQQMPRMEINALLYNLRTLEKKKFIADKDRASAARIMDICMQALDCILSELFNPDIAFFPHKEEKQCGYCPFKGFCV